MGDMMQINKEDICVGIVLYNPDLYRLKDNICSLRKQLENIVLIDNRSLNIEDVHSLYSKVSNVHFLKNEANKGIAMALNQMINWGMSKGFKWCLTMDQDSVTNESMISEMINAINNLDDVQNVGIVVPRIVDINMKADEGQSSDTEIVEIKRAEDVITSGSLINLGIIESVGKFDEKYFIDYVDTEFQERVLRQGYKIVKVNCAVLYHEVGHLEKHRFLFWNVLCSNHSAFRRYYQVRNRLAFKMKYYGKRAFVKEYLRLRLGDFKILFFENDKISKIKASRKGYKDYKLLL